jgi:hypothetical protein
MEKTSLLDPIKQIEEYDKYLASPGMDYYQKVEKARKRASSTVKSNARRAAADKKKDFANFMLTAAGAGLGLLGPAGFPLLNVGFASMSGGPVAAVVVGFTTALGESIRALNTFTQHVESVARSIGFVPKSLKLLEAQQQAREAFAGLGVLNARQAGIKLMNRHFQDIGFDRAQFEFTMAESWQGFIESAKRTGVKEITGAGGFGRSLERGAGLAPVGFVGRALYEAFQQDRQMEADRLPMMEDALKQYRAGVLQGTVGIESDPYEVWKRMQNAALDTAKGTELEIQLKQLAELEKLVEEARKRNPPASGAAMSAGLQAAAAAAAASGSQ